MKKIFTLIFLGGVLGLVSCNKFLDIQPQDRFLSDDVFRNEISVNNALNGIYLNLAKPALYGGHLTMSTVDVLAQYYGPISAWLRTTNYTYTDATVMNNFSTIWRSGYVVILNANSFLEQLTRSENVVSQSRKDLLMGEAYAIRAFVHFDLLRLFGPVYATEPTGRGIPYLTFATANIQPILAANVVMDSVIRDLNRAETFLANDPVRNQGVVPVTGTDPAGDFYRLRNRRLNYYAVLGIKARALLYRGDRVGALAAAQKVIQEAGSWFPWTAATATLPGTPNPDRVFSPEILFGVQNADLYSQQRMLFGAALSATTILAPVTERLNPIFENNENDYRFRISWASGIAYGKNFRTFIKFDDITAPEILYRNFQPLLRISEMYLIAAECTTDNTQALQYINTLRTNRGLADLAGNVSINTVIQNEFRKEFWGEGQTFFYYKRRALSSIPSGNPTGDLAMGPSRYVLPLPLSETQNR